MFKGVSTVSLNSERFTRLNIFFFLFAFDWYPCERILNMRVRAVQWYGVVVMLNRLDGRDLPCTGYLAFEMLRKINFSLIFKHDFLTGFEPVICKVVSDRLK